MTPHFTSTGRGPLTVVLTHGLAASGAIWAAQVEAWAPGHRIITWDLRGHGRSEPNPAPCTVAELAGDLRAVLDASRTEQAVILGHSAGGVVAMQLALDHPARVAALVLVGTASECNERARNFYEDLAALAETRGMEPVHRRLGVGADHARQAPTDPRTFASVARAMASLHTAPLTPRLGAIHCPVRVVVGDKDFLGVGGSVILHRALAGSELAIVPDRGHGIFLEDPVGFNALVGGFLARCDRSHRAGSER